MSSHKTRQSRTELTEELERLRASVGLLLEAETAEQIPEKSLQGLMTATINLYILKVDSGAHFPPLAQDDVTVTDVATTVVEMLEAVDMEVFELGMWKTWGIR